MKTRVLFSLCLAVAVASPAFAGKGNRCATRTPTLDEQEQTDRDLGPNRGRPASRIEVPVWVHVINKGSGFENGDVSDRMIRDQIRVLNETFGGERGGADTTFAFELAGVDRTTNADWFFMLPQTIEERRAKEALRQGGAETLNIYTVDGGPYLGWAYFPSGYDSQPALDGIVIDYRSMPGGPYVAFSLGFTATHEAGHWLALYHTFQNGCTPNNDYVADTPAERYPARGCPIGIDTCTGSRYPGLDPVENYMDYSDDPCYTQFTELQADRMRAAWVTYRQ